MNTRRRALGLLVAAGVASRFPAIPRALAAKTDCFDSKQIGPWKGQATDSQAGARINQIEFESAGECDLRADIQVAASFDSKLVVYGDRDQIKLPKSFLIDPANRLIVKGADGKCTPPEGGCFITSACCEMLGLDDDCFELRALRRYRDQVLAALPGGDTEIARYYALAPLILARLPEEMREARLILLYARFVLPAALAAHVGLDALAYRLYRSMLDELARDFAPDCYDRRRTGAEDLSAPAVSTPITDRAIGGSALGDFRLPLKVIGSLTASKAHTAASPVGCRDRAGPSRP